MSPEELTTRRTQAGLTQCDLSEMCGIDQGNLSKMERGQRTISERSTQRIDEALTAAELKREQARESMRQCVARVMNKPHLVAMRAQLAGQ